MHRFASVAFLFSSLFAALPPADAATPPQPANRLAYLDAALDPYYVHRDFPQLTTPQWIGEEGVEAVVTLAIDDMRDIERYEAYLRPILDRLKQIDGRAPVSIMTCNVDPQHPHLRTWRDEGLSIEVHTVDHPCPLLQGGDLPKAKSTYDRCVDMMAAIPENQPVAFRMPCCDSLNTPSPRFWTEIFNRTTPEGRYLQLDSSVFQLFTPNDEALPRQLVLDESAPRFRKYIPFPSFVNWIEDYPYPYVIGKLCWEFPCVVPSDWEAQNLQKPNNPKTVADMKAAIDAAVIKQGTFNLVFHPHGWIRNDQVVELIDHVVQTHGRKVKFLTFREAAERLNEHLLDGQPLRDDNGGDRGVRLLDVNNDGYLDVVLPGMVTKVWQPEAERWMRVDHKFDLQQPSFGILQASGNASMLNRERDGLHRYDWRGEAWQAVGETVPLEDLSQRWQAALREPQKALKAVRLHDLNADGRCELLISDGSESLILVQERPDSPWRPADFSFPEHVRLCRPDGGDAGLRLLDLNEDGRDDLVVSDAQYCSIHLFRDMQHGWNEQVLSAQRREDDAADLLPMIVRPDGSNNGFWYHSRTLWWQNEDTARLPDLVDRRSVEHLLAAHEARQKKRSAAAIPVGTARRDITPDYPVRLSGYGSRRQESEGVATRLWAKAVAIGGDDGAGPALLVNLENCGAPRAVTEQVAERLAESVGLPRERLVVCATHSHTAPHLNTLLPFIFGEPFPPEHQQHIARYTQELVDHLVQVAEAALADRRPAKLAWGQGRVGFAANRRVLKDGRWTGFGVQGDGPVDHSLPILVARDDQQQPIAVIVNYACHCTTLGGDFNQICGDWAGYAQHYIEKRFPGATALVTIGCGADANPEPRGGGLEQCQQHGRAVADEVARLLQTELHPVTSPLECRFTRIDLPLAPLPSLERWREQAEDRTQIGYHARHFLKRLEAGDELPTVVPCPVATWTFSDDLAMVFLGGEVVVDYAIRLKEEFDAKRLWITAYANDTPCYIPSKRILREGGYEADRSMIYYGQPTRLAEETEDLVVDTVQKLLPPRFYSAKKQQDFPPPLAPEQALQSMQIHADMQIELVAAEPLVADPVAIDWGPDGRMWVAEMHDYPNGVDGQGKPGGRIRFLEDADGDGVYDRSTLFLDDVPFPSGVKAWRKGVLVTAAPEVFYAEDTDGDGRADKRETLFEGFVEGNQQHRVNGLRWGLDNWLYLANGDSGGKVRSLKTGEEISISGRDLRIRPATGELQTVSGQTQYGRNRDDAGNWFGGNNSNPIWHYVLDDRYISRNPHVAAPGLRHQISLEPGAAPVFPTSRTLARFNDFDRANRFTSACSPIIYRDTLLGEPFLGNAFVCEPVHNLVSRQVLQPAGVTFTARRAAEEQQAEFLASSDNWFRPTMVRTGPDGAIWVVDMYRFVIEHPEWIPQQWQRKLDLRAGEERGRIYRIFPRGKRPRAIPRLDHLKTGELVQTLDSPNGWQRDTAQELLLWHSDPAAVEPLVKLAQSASNPLSRLHALCTLDGLGKLKDDVLLAALGDTDGRIRRHAARLSESRLNASQELATALVALVEDPDPHVQLQLAYSLGEWQDANAGRPLAELVAKHRHDPYLLAAALSSVNQDNLAVLLGQLEASTLLEASPQRLLQPLIAMAVAYEDATALEQLVAAVLPSGEETALSAERMQLLASALDALRSQGGGSTLLDKQLTQRLEEQQRAAAAVLEDPTADDDRRVAAVRLLALPLGGDEQDLARRLAAQLLPQNSQRLQVAVVEVLGNRGEPRIADLLLEGWPAHTPQIRAAILDQLLKRPTWTARLLDAVEAGRVAAAHIDASRRQQLRNQKDEAVRTRAERLLATSGDASRRAVLDQYQPALSLTGDVSRGRQWFEKHCASCHQLEGKGHAVGPDLTALTDKSPRALLTAMLDPNQAVEDKFLDYIALTDDGRQFTGILTAETGNSITLTGPDGKAQPLLRSQLDELRTSGKSLMPEGLERDLKPEQLADIIAYVRASTTTPAKKFEGNEPQVAPVRDDGSIRLLAIHARIYGPSLVFEPRYRNLGYWSSDRDRAEWTMRVPKAGTYRVSLDYACPDGVAGNRFQLIVSGNEPDAAEQTLGGQVVGSGSWDNYRGLTIGELQLDAGSYNVIFRSDGPVNGHLLDLRTIRLVPR